MQKIKFKGKATGIQRSNSAGSAEHAVDTVVCFEGSNNNARLAFRTTPVDAEAVCAAAQGLLLSYSDGPSLYQLFTFLNAKFSANISYAELNVQRNGSLSARLALHCAEDFFYLACRPLDALIFCLMQNKPILVADDIFESKYASFSISAPQANQPSGSAKNNRGTTPQNRQQHPAGQNSGKTPLNANIVKNSHNDADSAEALMIDQRKRALGIPTYGRIKNNNGNGAEEFALLKKNKLKPSDGFEFDNTPGEPALNATISILRPADDGSYEMVADELSLNDDIARQLVQILQGELGLGSPTQGSITVQGEIKGVNVDAENTASPDSPVAAQQATTIIRKAPASKTGAKRDWIKVLRNMNPETKIKM